MPGTRVVTDSACDLPAELTRSLGVEVVPLTIRFGSEELVDGQDLTPSEFWERCSRSPTLPETAAPSPGAFAAAFRRAAEAGAGGVVCVNLSSRLSATLQSAQAAAKEVAGDIPVRVVDSRSASLGEGILVRAAAELAAAGGDHDTVADQVEAMARRTRLVAALDTLDNLKKGGRIGGAEAFLGSLLSIKPVIQVVDGAVEKESTQRTRSRSLRHLIEVAKSEPIERLAVMQAEAPDLDDFLNMLSELVPRDQILVAQVGAVIGSHVGRGALGFCSIGPAA